MIARLSWRLAEVLSRTLQPDEREAVLGDLAERCAPGAQALSDVLGLVIRRQAVLWTDWRPWMTLVAVIVPLAMMLSLFSRDTADGSAVYAWLYVNNWDWALLRDAGFWFVLAESAKSVFVGYLTLVCWSWTCGFVLGSISRKMQVFVNGVLFCLALLIGELIAAPRYFAFYEHYRLRNVLRFRPPPNPHARIFAVTFYHAVFPLIVQAVLVALPALWGMREGARGKRPEIRTALWTLALVTIATMVIQTRGIGALLFVYGGPQVWAIGQIRLPLVILSWPLAYLVASAIARRWHAKVAPA